MQWRRILFKLKYNDYFKLLDCPRNIADRVKATLLL